VPSIIVGTLPGTDKRSFSTCDVSATIISLGFEQFRIVNMQQTKINVLFDKI